MKKPETKVRHFCFTDHKTSEVDKTWWRDFFENEKCAYLIYGNEVCPTTGKEHLQGFISFKNPRYLSALIKKTGGVHVEISRAPDAAVEYCKKEGKFVEMGEWIRKGQGARTDLDEMREMVIAGKSKAEIWMSGVSFQGYRMAEIGIKVLHLEPKRNWKPEVMWYWGPTGTGKSETAFKEIEEDGRPFWMKGEVVNNFLFPNYVDQELVWLDDFRPEEYRFNTLLQLLDKTPFSVRVLGDSAYMMARRIWITSPFHPANFYKGDEDVNQLLRRIDIIKEFGTGTRTEVEKVILASQLGGGSASPSTVVFTKIPYGRPI